MLWIETPSNPLLRVSDLTACCEIAREKGAVSLVDNTFATPYLQQPLALGAHLEYANRAELHPYLDVIVARSYGSVRRL